MEVHSDYYIINFMYLLYKKCPNHIRILPHFLGHRKPSGQFNKLKLRYINSQTPCRRYRQMNTQLQTKVTLVIIIRMINDDETCYFISYGPNILRTKVSYRVLTQCGFFYLLNLLFSSMNFKKPCI